MSAKLFACAGEGHCRGAFPQRERFRDLGDRAEIEIAAHKDDLFTLGERLYEARDRVAQRGGFSDLLAVARGQTFRKLLKRESDPRALLRVLRIIDIEGKVSADAPRVGLGRSG